MKVYITGTGMDGEWTLTLKARKVIEGARMLIGARRMLRPLEALKADDRMIAREFIYSYDFREIAGILKERARLCGSRYGSQDEEGCGSRHEAWSEDGCGDRHGAMGDGRSGNRYGAGIKDGCGDSRSRYNGSEGDYYAAVLVSGDCSFFSGARVLAGFLADEPCISLEFIPGISSLSYFCAALGTGMEDIRLISLHARSSNIAVKARLNRRSFFLLGGKVSASDLCRCLCEYGMPDVRISIGENLGMSGEQAGGGWPEWSAEPWQSGWPEGSAEPGNSAQPKGSEEPRHREWPGESVKSMRNGWPEWSAEPWQSGRPEGSAEPRQSGRPEGSAEPRQNGLPEGCAKPGLMVQEAGPGERITRGTARELSGITTENLAVALVENDDALKYIPSAIPDSEFIRGGRPMTKADVRALAVAALNICSDDTCWDVGCGTGSVSVEMAYRCADGRVYAFDKSEEACELTLANARRFGCDNINIIRADFPQDGVEYERPDSIFIGGSEGRLEDIVRLAVRLNPGVRIVITAVTLETLYEARRLLDELAGGCRIRQISAVYAEHTGRTDMLKAQNPVFIIQRA